MGVTLLVGNSQHQWKEWLAENRADQDLVVLDPSDPNWGTPCRIALYRGSKCVAWKFIGSLDASKNPIPLLAGAVQLMEQAQGDIVVKLFDFRSSPAMRQLALTIAQLIQPDEILVPAGMSLGMQGWPVGATEVPATAPFQGVVQTAQRRARWIELIESTEDHQTAIGDVYFEGCRFGSGRPLSKEAIQKAGLKDALWCEVAGNNLVIVTRKEPDEEVVARLMNVAHCSRATTIDPLQFSGRLCSFARQNGEDFGMGIVEEVDFTRGIIISRCTAVPPAPVRIIRLGLLRVDHSGRELAEDKPWTV